MSLQTEVPPRAQLTSLHYIQPYGRKAFQIVPYGCPDFESSSSSSSSSARALEKRSMIDFRTMENDYGVIFARGSIRMFDLKINNQGRKAGLECVRDQAFSRLSDEQFVEAGKDVQLYTRHLREVCTFDSSLIIAKGELYSLGQALWGLRFVRTLKWAQIVTRHISSLCDALAKSDMAHPLVRTLGQGTVERVKEAIAKVPEETNDNKVSAKMRRKGHVSPSCHQGAEGKGEVKVSHKEENSDGSSDQGCEYGSVRKEGRGAEAGAGGQQSFRSRGNKEVELVEEYNFLNIMSHFNDVSELRQMLQQKGRRGNADKKKPDTRSKGNRTETKADKEKSGRRNGGKGRGSAGLEAGGGGGKARSTDTEPGASVSSPLNCDEDGDDDSKDVEGAAGGTDIESPLPHLADESGEGWVTVQKGNNNKLHRNTEASSKMQQSMTVPNAEIHIPASTPTPTPNPTPTPLQRTATAAFHHHDFPSLRHSPSGVQNRTNNSPLPSAGAMPGSFNSRVPSTVPSHSTISSSSSPKFTSSTSLCKAVDACLSLSTRVLPRAVPVFSDVPSTTSSLSELHCTSPNIGPSQLPRTFAPVPPPHHQLNDLNRPKRTTTVQRNLDEDVCLLLGTPPPPVSPDPTKSAAPLCASCGVQSACMLLLDCAHLASCEPCSAFLRHCPVCNSPVRHTIHIFYS
mmetsp:Transcript_33199/g.53834  ORF Transcript_33199/g.53834 Transcript_33199/m.53834 type:complete len:683 (-) Transcript_33199:740-2788(-)